MSGYEEAKAELINKGRAPMSVSVRVSGDKWAQEQSDIQRNVLLDLYRSMAHLSVAPVQHFQARVEYLTWYGMTGERRWDPELDGEVADTVRITLSTFVKPIEVIPA